MNKIFIVFVLFVMLVYNSNAFCKLTILIVPCCNAICDTVQSSNNSQVTNNYNLTEIESPKNSNDISSNSFNELALLISLTSILITLLVLIAGGAYLVSVYSLKKKLKQLKKKVSEDINNLSQIKIQIVKNLLFSIQYIEESRRIISETLEVIKITTTSDDVDNKINNLLSSIENLEDSKELYNLEYIGNLSPDEDPEIISLALKAVGVMLNTEAIPMIKTLIDSPNISEEIKVLAKETLRIIQMSQND